MRRAAAALAACLAATGAVAADPRWYVQIDNDLVFHTDRWYSSGVRIARAWDHGGYELEAGISQEIYTPEAKRFVPGTVDRAPSARLLASLARHDSASHCLRTLELALGVRGPSAQGERTTESIHRLVPAPEVDWSREEGDKFEAQLAATRSQRHRDAVLHFGGVVGTTRTFGHAGAQWNFGAGMQSELLRFAPTPPPAAGESRWGGFIGASARAVARDELLARGYDRFAPAPEREHWVGRAAAGVALVQPWGSVTFSLAADTREFEGQRTPQRFGSLAVHVAF